MRPGIDRPGSGSGPYAVIVVADYLPVRAAIADTYEQAEQVLREWYATSRDLVFKNGYVPTCTPDPATATYDDIEGWYTQDDESGYYIDILPLNRASNNKQ